MVTLRKKSPSHAKFLRIRGRVFIQIFNQALNQKLISKLVLQKI